jgi:hypothetical protein
MAAIDFPAAPTVGQQFVAANGVTYQWSGVMWFAVASSPVVSLKTNVPNAVATPQFVNFQVSWASIDFNNGGGAWNGTQYTVAVAGLYMIDFSLGLTWPVISGGANTYTQGEAHIFINGADIAIGSINMIEQQGPAQVSYQVHWRGMLSVGNTVDFQGWWGFGGPATFNPDKRWSWASIIRLSG